MWNKIKQSKYLLLGQYFLMGIFLGALTYQLVTQSLLNQRIDLMVFFEEDTLGFIFACLVGGVFGGIGFVIFSLNDKTRVKREANNWAIMKKSKISTVILKAMFALSVGAFVGMLAKQAIDLESYTNVMSSLFSSENVIVYIGAVVAACVFAIPISIGAMKRLKLLYNN